MIVLHRPFPLPDRRGQNEASGGETFFIGLRVVECQKQSDDRQYHSGAHQGRGSIGADERRRTEDVEHHDVGYGNGHCIRIPEANKREGGVVMCNFIVTTLFFGNTERRCRVRST